MIINKQINTKGNFSLKKRKVLIDSLHELLNGNFVKYYFDNVIEYVEKILSDIQKLELNSQLKREIIINSKMVILSAELCKVRIGCMPDADKVKSIVSLIDCIYEEYHTLWCLCNFQKGEEHFLNQLSSRKKELLEMYPINNKCRKGV